VGLVEAYEGTAEVQRDDIATRKTDALTFYLGRRAVELEHHLGIDLAAASIFGEPNRSGRWPELFMLMPFEEPLRPVFEDHVKKVARLLKLSAGRADALFTQRSVVHDIWSAMSHARVIVADRTRRNPNVFYEIGMAHTIGKDTVLISQSIDDVPFDLRHLRVIIYELTPRGMAQFERDLKAALQNLLDESRGRPPTSKSEAARIQKQWADGCAVLRPWGDTKPHAFPPFPKSLSVETRRPKATHIRSKKRRDDR
jgi:hypothetical protein